MPRETISLPQPSPRKLRSRVVSKKRTLIDQDSTAIPPTSSGPGPIHDALQNVGVNVGAKTQRDRMLSMLSRHLIRKKPRLSAGIVPDITPKFSRGKPPKRDSLDCNPLDEGRFHTPQNDVIEVNSDGSFSQFGNHDLVKMIAGVGINAVGWDREKLITTCQEYNELTPVVSFAGPSEPIATSSSAKVSTSSLPSLEHNRLEYPRPHPTRLSFSRSQKDKGKAKAVSDNEDDWDPFNDDPGDSTEDAENSEASEKNNQVTTPASKKKQHQARPTQGKQRRGFKATKENVTVEKTPPPTSSKNVADETPASAKDGEKSSPEQGSTSWMIEKIYQLQAHIARSDKKYESLVKEMKVMSDIIMKGIEKRKVKTVKTNKTRGGTTAAHIRFHIETLFGQSVIPPPATESEKESWMRDVNPSTNECDDPSDPQRYPHQPSTSADPHFPYPDGPGHKDATTQQLSIMWNMMQSVGLSSFRPNFAESPTSKDNKWLWDIALKIFIKLVECGEYTGVPLGDDENAFIKKCLSTHIRSLTKRYQNQQWEETRRKKTADEARRGSRLRYLRQLREDLIFSQEKLWPLSEIVTAACSDDETDIEHNTSVEGSTQRSIPCRIRKLAWRSEQLENVCKLLDSAKSRNDSANPQSNRSTPKQGGRPARTRFRCREGPVSRVAAPVGLPTDCYSSEWLKSLSPLEVSQLDITTAPILDEFIPLLERL
ncbi:hypothetical protein DFH28DRAFT_1079551 [Melampsora americana]|nr:hypothetical protein DFH28DRAFT_1079551 [Melampsora americana]